MKNIIIAMVIIGVLVLSGCAGTTQQKTTEKEINTGVQEETQASASEMVDCGKAEDPSCFLNRMNSCLPVTAKMTGTDGSTAIDITILGIVNDTCHFQRKLNDVLNLDCYFPKGTMNMDTLDQTFGNDKGLQKVVDDNCKSPGW
jgi:PBP1b-binding outer membrane lipoprotein LpoB